MSRSKCVLSDAGKRRAHDATERVTKMQASSCSLSWDLRWVSLWTLLFPVSEANMSTGLACLGRHLLWRILQLLGGVFHRPLCLMAPSAVQVLHFLINLLSGCFTHYWKSTQLSFEISKFSTIITGLSISPFESDRVFYILTQHWLVCYKPLFPEFWKTWFGYFLLISQYFWGGTEAGSCLVHHFEHGSPNGAFWHSSHHSPEQDKKANLLSNRGSYRSECKGWASARGLCLLHSCGPCVSRGIMEWLEM